MLDSLSETLRDRKLYKLNHNTPGDIRDQTTVDKFVQAVNEDPNLMAELKAAVDIESYYRIAKEHGYHFTPEKLNSELSKQSLEELAMTINPGMTPRKHLDGR